MHYWFEKSKNQKSKNEVPANTVVQDNNACSRCNSIDNMEGLFDEVEAQLKFYFQANRQYAVPSSTWIAGCVVRILLQYPAGLSKSILLAEIEAKWHVIYSL
jgi:hypothetical protein